VFICVHLWEKLLLPFLLLVAATPRWVHRWLISPLSVSCFRAVLNGHSRVFVMAFFSPIPPSRIPSIPSISLYPRPLFRHRLPSVSLCLCDSYKNNSGVNLFVTAFLPLTNAFSPPPLDHRAIPLRNAFVNSSTNVVFSSLVRHPTLPAETWFRLNQPGRVQDRISFAQPVLREGLMKTSSNCRSFQGLLGCLQPIRI